MQTYINRRPVTGPWGGGAQFINAYHRHSRTTGVELVSGSLACPDVMLLAGLDNDGTDIGVEQAIAYKMYMKPGCKLVLRVNECDARKGTDRLDTWLVEASKHVDGTVFVSRWLQAYFIRKGWACKNQAVIVNGVDGNVFKPGPKAADGRLHIVAHHWSDNRMKGADVYERLDELVGERPDQFAFTYIGRHKCDFKHARVVKPLHGRELGDELGRHDVYVSASRFDPGPNHVLEALSCRLPTYVHSDGGGCVEFAGGHASYRDWDTLRALLTCEHTLGPARERGEPLNPMALSTWQTCVQEYNAFLGATWQDRSGLQGC